MPAENSTAYYDDLENTLSYAHSLLGRAVDQLKSPLRTPVLASISQDAKGAYSTSSRIVVMRQFDAGKRYFSFYTDSRSSKVLEIEHHPVVSAVFYDPEKRIQLRLSGLCSIHSKDDETAKIWSGLPAQNKALYGTEPGPGTAISAGHDYETDSNGATLQSELNFCIVKVNYNHLEWLYLTPEGHRRAHFQWQSNGKLESHWVAP